MKFASAFMVTAEIAFYFGTLLLIRIFQPLAMAMLLFTGLVFVCMFLAELLRKIWPLRILLLIIPAGALLIAPVDMKLILFFPPFVYALLTAALDRFYREHWRYVLVYKALFVIALVLVLISLIGNPDKYTSFYHTLVFIGIFFAFLAVSVGMLNVYPTTTARDVVFSAKQSALLSRAGVMSSSLAALEKLSPEGVLILHCNN